MSKSKSFSYFDDKFLRRVFLGCINATLNISSNPSSSKVARFFINKTLDCTFGIGSNAVGGTSMTTEALPAL